MDELIRLYISSLQLKKHATGHSIVDILNRDFIVFITGSTDTQQELPGSTIRDAPRGMIFDPKKDPIPVTIGDFIELLEQGYTLDHREPPYGGNGALMAVFSGDLLRESIWDSMYNRHTYASTGARALLYFSIRDTTDSGNTAIMGDEIYMDGNPEILVYVAGEYGSIIEQIQIIKNERAIIAKMIDQKDVIFQFVDRDYDGTPSHYFLRIVEKQSESFNHDDDFKYDKGKIIGPQLDELLWSSPIWVYQAQ